MAIVPLGCRVGYQRGVITMERFIKLSDRLQVIADFIEDGAAVADIGTDHGYLPVYLAQRGTSRHIVASDVSMDSLETARNSARKHGVSDKITFVCSSGLAGKSESDTDTIVIAGLGGETIAGILRDAPWTHRPDIRLILQPQTKTSELCIYLRQCRYSLRGAKLTLDNGRIYVVMLVNGGESESILEPEVELFARLMHSGDPLLGNYLDDLIAKTNRALEGMRSTGGREALDIALKLSVYISMRELLNKQEK